MNVVCVINDSHAVRERSSEDVTVLECGCAHTDTAWIQECRAHAAEWNERHERAAKDHEREAFIRELTS